MFWVTLFQLFIAAIMAFMGGAFNAAAQDPFSDHTEQQRNKMAFVGTAFIFAAVYMVIVVAWRIFLTSW